MPSKQSVELTKYQPSICSQNVIKDQGDKKTDRQNASSQNVHLTYVKVSKCQVEKIYI
jgi:hypothetical protein